LAAILSELPVVGGLSIVFDRITKGDELMMRLKVVTAATLTMAMLTLVVVSAQESAQPSDATAFYNSKCVACHGKKAEKKFDASLADEQLVEAVLKGKKAEKPPNMPAYGEKGVTEDQAKALVDHMKHLKATP
jgi:mono/diheme cytochrome c family protein